MKMVLSLVFACILGIMLFASGLFAAKEQGPPGLSFFSESSHNFAVLSLAAVVAAGVVLVLAASKSLSRERLWGFATVLLGFCLYVIEQFINFGKAAVRLVPQSHYQTSRERSFATS